MPFPTYFKNPFIKTQDTLYSRTELYDRICLNDLLIIPFKDINIRKQIDGEPWTNIRKTGVINADIRYPGIVYKAHLDPLKHSSVTREYCIFDGTHRLVSMIEKGLKANVFYLLTPKHFIGLQEYPNFMARTGRTTGCGGCGE